MNGIDREDAIREHFPLVRHIARRVRYLARGADLDDLIGDGSIGLIRAVDTYDASRGIELDTYARHLIAGAMLNGLRRLDTVSERVRRKLRRAEEERFVLAQERGTLPSLAELDGRDPALRRARITAFRQSSLSLDAPLPGGDEPLADRSHDPCDEAVASAKRARIREAIELLPKRQQRILALHYANEVSLHAIGMRLGVSAQRVSQLHLNALARLRRTLPAP